MMKRALSITFFLCIISASFSQKYQPTWESLDTRPIPSWFEDAKFGIFIHWGLYSVPAWRKLEPGLYASYAEWYYARVMRNADNGGMDFHHRNYGENFSYRDFAPLFKAELFEPDYWAELFRKAGAKYVVLTSKHHDGYCLWPSTSPYKKDWNSMDTGPERDLVGDLSSAVRSAGLRMGLYYSIIEWESSWTHRTESGYYVPDSVVDKYKIPEDKYVDQHLIPQLKELVENYSPSLIFSDGGEWDGSEEYFKTKEFLAWLYNKSPIKNEIVVNDRWAKGMPGKHGDYFSSEYKDMEDVDVNHPWEESRGIGGSYGFNRAENIADYSSSADLIYELIDIVSRGGNLLLNVGPTADGRIPVIMQQRLMDIGAWLDINGEAIYQTRKWTTNHLQSESQELYFTAKRETLYCIFLKWNEKIELELINGKEIKEISLLGSDGKVNWELTGDKRVVIELPCLRPGEVPSDYAWTLKIK